MVGYCCVKEAEGEGGCGELVRYGGRRWNVLVLNVVWEVEEKGTVVETGS